MTPHESALPDRLRGFLGADGVLTEPADCAPFLVDHLGRCRGRALAVVQPRSVAQVAQILAFCEAERIGVVPHAGNTSYCGGAIPDESGRQLVLSLRRLTRIRSLDPDNYSLVAEAGCVLAQVQAAADYFRAEDYHQEYFRNNPEQGYCMMVVSPKVEKFRRTFARKRKTAAATSTSASA